MKGKKQTIGKIKGADLLKRSRGIQQISFKTSAYLTEKDRPRDKNWHKWINKDDI